MILPVAVFLALWRLAQRSGDSTREATLRAIVITTAVLVVITELLSVFRLITRSAFMAAWAIALISVLSLFRRSSGRIESSKRYPLHSAVHVPAHLVRVDLVLGATIAGVLAVIGVIAIIAPPNTSDGMEYHLPRMIFWVSNHTVRNFPTPDYAQLIQSPAAEFITLHTYLLFGSDRLVNLVEFFSLFGSAIAVSLIAGKFGAGRSGQLLAALFVVTIPEAVLESSGAMTTVAVSFWIVNACYFTIRAIKDQRTFDVVSAGLAIGLALLTKGIAFIYLPFLVPACILFRPAPRRIWMLKRIPLVMLIAIAINTPQFIRAYQVTGTPLGAPFPAGGPRLHFGNDHITPASVAASVIRQATLHMETPSDKINARIESVVRRTIRLTGSDPDDPTAVWLGYPFYIGHPSRLETQAGNPLHFLLLIFTFAALPFLSRKLEPKDRSILPYAVGIVASFVAFCAVIRWQPWGSRFHLPLFVLSGAIIGVLVERMSKSRWPIALLSTVLVSNALPYLFSNSIRSMLPIRKFSTLYEPRAELYFADQHTALAPDYLALAAAINTSKCASVAIDAWLTAPDSEIINSPPAFYIYPLLAQLHIDGLRRTVRYIDVGNPTQRFAVQKPTATPCAIVCLSCGSHKSHAGLGPTQTFGDSELTFPSPRP